MKRLIAFTVILFLIGQSAWASHTAIIGGLRSGLAFGMETKKDFNERFSGRFGVEATTGEDLSLLGDNPYVMFIEGRLHLFDFGRAPMSAGLGLIGNYGNQTEYGGSLSLIFENIYDQEHLFLEAGIDYTSHGHLHLQVGYKIF